MNFLHKLRDLGDLRHIEWCGGLPTSSDALFNSVQLAGEVGELCNVMKKMIREYNNFKGGVPAPAALQMIREEMGDIVISLDLLASSLDIDLEQCITEKFNATSDKYNFETRFEKPSEEPYIGVDLDGTLARYEGWAPLDEIGEPIPKMIGKVKALKALGENIKIITARCAAIGTADRVTGKKLRYCDVIEPIQKWCEIHLDFIPEVTNEKDYLMKYCLDDRAVAVKLNDGECMGWGDQIPTKWLIKPGAESDGV